MIDFHSHILPNVDDGSKSTEETFKLIQEARNAGFDGIISTSHYMESYYEVENKERQIWIDAISKKLEEQNLKIKLYLGNEIYITENIIELIEEGKASTINNTNYVLFEMPLNVKPMNLYDSIFEILKNKFVPILAHPERYSFVQKDPELIYDLMQKGVLMQSNYGSFIGQYGENAQIIAKALLKNDMIHFLGSDVHRKETIYPRIPQIIKYLKELVGEKNVNQLTIINPQIVLNNEKIEISDPQQIKLSIRDRLKINLKSR